MSFNVKARRQPLLSSVGTYLFQKIFIYLYLGAKECMCHDIGRGRVREQLVAVGTFLLPYGSWGIRLSFQTLWQAPLPIESHLAATQNLFLETESLNGLQDHHKLDWLSSESQGSS